MLVCTACIRLIIEPDMFTGLINTKRLLFMNTICVPWRLWTVHCGYWSLLSAQLKLVYLLKITLCNSVL